MFLKSVTARIICFGLALVLLPLFCCKTLAAPASPEPKSTAQNKPTLLKGNINQLMVLCSYAGITLDKDALPAKVSKIRLGTPAAYSGLSENDQVLAATVEKDQLSLQIARLGKKFSLRLPISAAALRAATNAGANTAIPNLKMGPTPKLAAVTMPYTGIAISNETPEQKRAFNAFCQAHSKNLPKAKLVSELKDIRALKDYEFAVLVDHSGSMRQSITTGRVRNSTETSTEPNKWEWIQNQMTGAGEELLKAFSKGVKLIMFATDYQVFNNCRPTEMFNIFERTKAMGENFLIPPLREVLKEKITSGKPMIICIVTDGLALCPYDDLRECIISATKAIPGKYDLAIYFLVVNTKNPDVDLGTLKADLMAQGAAYDIVNVKSFEEIDSKGLINTFVETASN